jgi:hypothetical protein
MILDDNTSKVCIVNNSSRPCKTSTAVRRCVASGREEDCIRSQAPQQSIVLEEGGRRGRKRRKRRSSRRRSRQDATENSHIRELTYPHKALSHFSRKYCLRKYNGYWS